MDVHVVADDPIREAVAAALRDVDVGIRDADLDGLESARFAVVGGVAGSEAFHEANEAALAGGTPWIAVEVGGVGGRAFADVDAAVSGFSPSTACFECLRSRVASTTGAGDVADRPSADRSAVRLAGAVAGRECVRVLAGEDGSLLGSVRELPHARRRLLPVPGCDCGPGRDRTLDRDEGTLDLEAALDRAERAVDGRLGPVTEIGEAHSHPAPYYLATTADATAFGDADAPANAAGVDVDWNGALMKALGEALERYAAAVYREDDFVRARAATLENPVPPTALVRPEDAPAFDPDVRYRWVEGENLATGEPVQLPAAAVHFPQPGDRLVPPITTGLGLGSSTVDALVAGLTEVIERDAAVLSWYSTYDPLELAIEDEGYETLARRARAEGLVATSLLVTQDVDVPVVATAVHREELDRTVDPDAAAWPAFAIGSAAALSAPAAARSALAEALQNWTELRALGPDAAADESGAIGEYAAFPEPIRAFLEVDRSVPAASVGPDPVPEGLERLETLCDRVADAGLTPYAARVTTRDVEALGFEAVRVVVPGAQPLFTGEPFFGERARTVPADLGFEPRLDGPYHPYP